MSRPVLVVPTRHYMAHAAREIIVGRAAMLLEGGEILSRARQLAVQSEYWELASPHGNLPLNLLFEKSGVQYGLTLSTLDDFTKLVIDVVSHEPGSTDSIYLVVDPDEPDPRKQIVDMRLYTTFVLSKSFKLRPEDLVTVFDLALPLGEQVN